METTRRRSGRPKKPEHEKVQYQRIAVYAEDYSKLVSEISKRNKGKLPSDKLKLTDAFSAMVDNYTKK